MFLSKLAAVFIVLVYITTSLSVNSGSLLKSSQTPYFTYLAKSFFSAKLDLSVAENSGVYDLSSYNNKLYMYWGFPPVILILPFLLFFGGNPSDVLYTLIIGLANCWLFYLLLETLSQKFRKITEIRKTFLLIAFSLVSPNFYLSMAGRVWHFSQVGSIFFLLLFLIFWLKSLNENERAGNYMWSLVFFVFAVLARNTLLVYGILYLWQLFKTDPFTRKTRFIRLTTAVLVAAGIYFFYNYVRFGRVTETGISYQLSDPRFSSFLRLGRLYSPEFFAHNFRTYFLSKSVFSPEGGGLFFVYPYTLFLGFFLKKRYLAENYLIGPFLVVFLLLLCGNLFFVGTGWTQFGLRYLFDAVPAILIVLFLVEIDSLYWLFVLLMGGVVNYAGTKNFFTHY